MAPLFTGSKIGYFSDATDPYFSNVVLLLHLDGRNGDTTFIDSSFYNRTITRGTGASISNNAGLFGSSSIYLNGTNTANLNWSPITLSSNFTVEMFVRFDDYTLTGSLISNVPNGRNNDGFLFNEGGVQGKWRTNIDNGIVLSSTVLPTMQNDTFYHVALTKSGTTYRSFFNGTQLQTATSSALPTYSRLGGYFYSSVKGYVDEVRITDGIARYTSNFTVPTAPFPNS